MGVNIERAREDAFHDGVLLALQVISAAGDCGSATYEELVGACGLDNLVKRARSEGMMRLTGLSEYLRQIRRHR